MLKYLHVCILTIIKILFYTFVITYQLYKRALLIETRFNKVNIFQDSPCRYCSRILAPMYFNKEKDISSRKMISDRSKTARSEVSSWFHVVRFVARHHRSYLEEHRRQERGVRAARREPQVGLEG